MFGAIEEEDFVDDAQIVCQIRIILFSKFFSLKRNSRFEIVIFITTLIEQK
jgi:hypothetical protein